MAGRSLTDYEKYIRTEELLDLQKPEVERVNPHELLFQVTHQAAELWMKEILFELGRAGELMGRDEMVQAAALIERCALILVNLADSVEVLETLAPADYHVIRTQALGRGSGQESPGFNRLLDAPQPLWEAYQAVMKRAGVTPLEVQREPLRDEAAYRLTQAMMEYDERFQKWRYIHYGLVRRIIGAHVLSLKGVPASALEKGTMTSLFPELWKAIELLTDEWKPTY